MQCQVDRLCLNVSLIMPKLRTLESTALAGVSSLVAASKLGRNVRFCLVSLVTSRSFLQPRHPVHHWIKHQQGIFGSGSEHKLSFCSGLLAFI